MLTIFRVSFTLLIQVVNLIPTASAGWSSYRVKLHKPVSSSPPRQPFCSQKRLVRSRCKERKNFGFELPVRVGLAARQQPAKSAGCAPRPHNIAFVASGLSGSLLALGWTCWRFQLRTWYLEVESTRRPSILQCASPCQVSYLRAVFQAGVYLKS